MSNAPVISGIASRVGVGVEQTNKEWVTVGHAATMMRAAAVDSEKRR